MGTKDTLSIPAPPRLPALSRLRPAALALLGLLLLPVPPAAQAQPAQAAAGPPPVPVTVAVAGKRDVPILLRNIGVVQAYQTAAIRTRVDGTLEQVLFTEGEEVKRGQLLAKIDPRPYQALLELAIARKAANEAALANARLDLQRSTDLAKGNFASRQVVDTRASQVAQLEAQLKADDATINAARVNVEYTNILAPFDGRMGLRQVDVGNVLRFADNAATAVIATISQIRPIVVMFTLGQDHLPAIKAAMARGKLPVMAFSPDDRTELGRGELLTVDSAIDQATGTIRLKAVFANDDTRLWPGQFVNVRLQLEVQTDVIAVPSAAVQRGPSGLFVYTVKDDQTVGIQAVTLGQDDGALAVVREGLEAGVRVVVAGQSRLRAGARVMVNQPSGPPAAPGARPAAAAGARPSG
jgi:multidrug efflux system membrane fusion protein